jgi:hypothetical protein
MNKRSSAVLLGMAVSLALASATYAKSTLLSLAVEPIWPTNSAPGNVLFYKVTVGRGGSGLLNVSLSGLGLPSEATMTFSPSVLRFTGHVPTHQTAIMTVTCVKPTPVDTYPFTVTATAASGSITVTNHVTFEPFSLVGRPSVLEIDRLEAGSFRLRGMGATGEAYTILATMSLVKPAWTPVGSCTADGNGRFIFTPPASSAPMEFFRAAAAK